MYSSEHLIYTDVKSRGGRLYRVGGCVRDEITGMDPKDVDYLVTGLELIEIKNIVEQYGIANEVGRSFGIITVRIGKYDYDFSMPRSEMSSGAGHSDFELTLDKNISLVEDLSRRDFTIGAIAKDVETGEYVDPFGGVEDIKAGRIKAVRDPKERFTEDPLRMLRAIQFANRFGFSLEPETMKAIRDNVSMIDNITGERILEEFKKAFTKGKYDSNKNFVSLLTDTGLGKHIFGSDFSPVAVEGIKGDKFIVNMMLLFLNGGDFSKLKPSVEVATAITLGRKFMREDALAVMFKNRAYFPVVEGMALSIGDSSLLSKLKSLEGVPLSSKELNIDSNWLMSIGIQGKALGDTQKELVQAIYERKVPNSEPELRELVEV